MRYLSMLLLVIMLATLQGCAGGGGHAADRRSSGTQIEDETIEKLSSTRIKEKYSDSIQVTITSFNRFVLITGEALSEEIKTDIERIVRSVPNVKKTSNEVFVGSLSSSSARRNDSGVSGKIKSEIRKNKTLNSGAVQIITSRGIVYLMGFATHAEATAISTLASRTTGAQKVVRVFEYID